MRFNLLNLFFIIINLLLLVAQHYANVTVTVPASSNVSSSTTAAPPLPSPTTQPIPTSTIAPKPKFTEKPNKKSAGVDFDKQLIDWLFTGCWKTNTERPDHTSCDYVCDDGEDCSDKYHSAEEYPGYDGWYNNVGKPELGAVDTPLLRKLPAVYKDGVYKPISGLNPFDLSDKLLKGEIGTPSRTGKNALLVFFGQQVVEEILDAQRPACPPEYINIEIPENHEYRNSNTSKHTEMPVLRTRYDQRTGHSPNNPRQQLNEITPYLDGGLIYGTSKAWSDQLRMNENGIVQPKGQLASSSSGKYPALNTIKLPMANPPPPAHHHLYIKQHYTENVTRFFMLGNPRGNENPFLLTFGVVWFRWHNFLAKHISRYHSNWTSDKIYNEARKWVIATQQHIVVNEWLPQWLGGNKLAPYKSYNPNIDPQIDQFFQSAAFRFGHTLVPPGVYLRDYGRNNCTLERPPVRTCNNYWMSKNALFYNETNKYNIFDVDRLLMGMAIQLCEAEDHKIVKDLRGSLFGPLEFSRRDLMALNIQRARDHGIPDFNSARSAYGLPKIYNVSHFKNVKDEIKCEFLKLYNYSFHNVDIWVGGILETGDAPGELFQKIIIDQFQRIRDGDRFWYQNEKNKLFTSSQINRISQLSIYDLLMCVTEMEWNDIPKNPFRVPKTVEEMHDSCKKNNVIKEGSCNTGPCFHADIITNSIIEDCTELGTYDFFSNSKVSFVFTFLSITTFFCGLITVIFYKIQSKEKGLNKEYNTEVDYVNNVDSILTGKFPAREWQEPKSSLKHVLITTNIRTRQLEVKNQLGNLIRAMEFPCNSNVMIYCATDNHYVLIRVHHSYDLVLKFDSEYIKISFIKAFDKFMSEIAAVGNVCSVQKTNVTLAVMLKQAITKRHRQKKLEMFFRVVFAQAFHIAHTEEEILQIDSTVAKEVIYTELTIIEFAEALSMRPDSEFVKKIFNLVDKDNNGFISFREFVDLLVIFLKGSAEEKIKLMFDMYDINGTGTLKREEFSNMLRSFMETVNTDVTDDELETLVQSMMYHADLANKETINLQDFHQILADFNNQFNYAELEFNVHAKGKNRTLHAGVKTVRSTFIGEVQKTVESLYADPVELQSRVKGKIENEQDETEQTRRDSEIIDRNEKIVEEVKKYSDDYWYPIMKYLANKRLQIFWACLYTLLLFGIFAERVYYYSIEREHSGLRRILGYGLTITRGAASAMMFTYSTLLLMMCHNTITILRTTVLQFYFPFDSTIDMHKYIACWALVFTVLHIIGHGFNFYHISTQTADDLTCLFRNYYHASHELPKFHYWCYGTMTGITGVFLTIVTGLIFICSLPMVRKTFYNWFSFVHSLYPVFYLLMVLHGSGRLVQEPYFQYFFLGPAILFILDKVVTVTRTKIETPILKADILPSGVTCLIFPKPLNFQYKSGQWIRVACPALRTTEYHPFTLSSAPHETSLSIHIRAVGPWTKNIRDKLDQCIMSNDNLPMIHIDGPYGEGHQDWDKYEVAIMVGGGIGVTPYASILKDIVFRSNHKVNFSCKKVYFVWVTRTQKQFEWMVDLLRDLEKTDIKNTVSIHIFVTQFYQKFDLRTILLYICERHFQKISNKSLFTGLKAVTHFGRPKFSQFFLSIQKLHPTANKIGVFSCGTPTMTQAVDTACKAINLTEINDTIFQHIYKSF